ncbi:hypothetical protein J4E86_006915 [Alternaria arbusti]|uniref:uncharacterized protein n=1 Tax=Alternaria arbusti TaxID=232088 RepID=UPI0022212377|nr:uncharacterized protein J4E86_006915 [Alternaria arbusti]KAI4953372.1 hypothetical protein J4E86_006915 [Alternaria arbusti]
MSINPALPGLLLYNLANPMALLSVPPEHLHSGLAAQLADATARADAVEMRLERLEPLADEDAQCLPALQAEAKRLTERKPFMSEIDRFRGYIDPLWEESVRFAEAAFRHAGIYHEEWPLVSAETDVQDAKSWFTERANELSDGITSVQNTANEAAVTAQKTAVDAALATQKQELEGKAGSAQVTAIQIALAAQKDGLESNADLLQQAAIKIALATQKDDLDSKAQSAQDTAIRQALAAQKSDLNSKAQSAQDTAIEKALEAQKKHLESEARSAQKDAVEEALAAQKRKLKDEGKSTQDTAVQKALAAQQKELASTAASAHKTELEKALADQKKDLESKINPIFKAKLATQKSDLEAKAKSALDAAVNTALAAQKKDLESKAKSAQDAALKAQKLASDDEAAKAQNSALKDQKTKLTDFRDRQQRRSLESQQERLDTLAANDKKIALDAQEKLLKSQESASKKVWGEKYRQEMKTWLAGHKEQQAKLHEKALAKLQASLDAEKADHTQLKTAHERLETDYKQLNGDNALDAGHSLQEMGLALDSATERARDLAQQLKNAQRKIDAAQDATAEALDEKDLLEDALLEELRIASGKLNTTRQQRDAAIVEIKGLEAELAVEFDYNVDKHRENADLYGRFMERTGELARSQQAHRRELIMANETATNALATKETEHEEALKEQRAEHEKQLTAKDTYCNEVLHSQKETHDKTLRQNTEAHEEAAKKASKAADEKYATLESSLSAKESTHKEELSKAQQALITEEGKLEELRQSSKRELDTQASTYEEKLSKAQQVLITEEGKLEELRQSSNRELDTQASTYKEKLSKAQEALTTEEGKLEKLRQSSREELDAQVNTHKEELGKSQEAVAIEQGKVALLDAAATKDEGTILSLRADLTASVSRYQHLDRRTTHELAEGRRQKLSQALRHAETLVILQERLDFAENHLISADNSVALWKKNFQSLRTEAAEVMRIVAQFDSPKFAITPCKGTVLQRVTHLLSSSHADTEMRMSQLLEALVAFTSACFDDMGLTHTEWPLLTAKNCLEDSAIHGWLGSRLSELSTGAESNLLAQMVVIQEGQRKFASLRASACEFAAAAITRADASQPLTLLDETSSVEELAQHFKSCQASLEIACVDKALRHDHAVNDALNRVHQGVAKMLGVAGIDTASWTQLATLTDIEHISKWFSLRSHELQDELDCRLMISHADSARAARSVMDPLSCLVDIILHDISGNTPQYEMMSIALTEQDIIDWTESRMAELQTANRDNLFKLVDNIFASSALNKPQRPVGLIDYATLTRWLGDRVLDINSHHQQMDAAIDAANDEAIKLVLRLGADLSVVIPDHNSASWPELWKDVSTHLHGEIQHAHDAQRTFQVGILEAAESFAKAVFDAQGISHRWPELNSEDLTSIKTWFACRGDTFTQTVRRDKIARESKIFKSLHHFALLATGAKSFPVKLVADCDLSAFESWLADRTSEVSERLLLGEEKTEAALNNANASFELQDRMRARWASETEQTHMLRERLRLLAQRYRVLLSAHRN